jgi:hypothetical protein
MLLFSTVRIELTFRVFVVEAAGTAPASDLLFGLLQRLRIIYSTNFKRVNRLSGSLAPLDFDPHALMEVVGDRLHNIHQYGYLETNPVCRDDGGYDAPCDRLCYGPGVCLCQLKPSRRKHRIPIRDPACISTLTVYLWHLFCAING